MNSSCGNSKLNFGDMHQELFEEPQLPQGQRSIALSKIKALTKPVKLEALNAAVEAVCVAHSPASLSGSTTLHAS